MQVRQSMQDARDDSDGRAKRRNRSNSIGDWSTDYEWNVASPSGSPMELDDAAAVSTKGLAAIVAAAHVDRSAGAGAGAGAGSPGDGASGNALQSGLHTTSATDDSTRSYRIAAIRRVWCPLPGTAAWLNTELGAASEQGEDLDSSIYPSGFWASGESAWTEDINLGNAISAKEDAAIAAVRVHGDPPLPPPPLTLHLI
jgi:hypothetical protein